jgi:hypothetical protein
MVGVADTASLMCHGSIIFQGDPARVRDYYGQRCRPHGDSLGAQPWISSQATDEA